MEFVVEGVRNPLCPSFCFILDRPGHAIIGCFINQVVDGGTFVRTLLSSELDSLFLRIQQRLTLVSLSWKEFLSRISIVIHVSDMDKIYQVLQEVVNEGHTVMIEDRTEVNFPAGSEVTLETHQKRFLVQLVELQTLYHQTSEDLLRRFFAEFPLTTPAVWNNLPHNVEIAAFFKAMADRTTMSADSLSVVLRYVSGLVNEMPRCQQIRPPHRTSPLEQGQGPEQQT
eukprot:GILJ01019292.1.p1 GENE.GILJ01019292.1~~GILJ01019292.1.p1  ORF type:complete len:227 (+),score=23.59 GILJ01019292.1:109-789(+)